MKTIHYHMKRKISEQQEYIRSLEHQDFINSCSDNFYHTSGRYAQMRERIDAARNELEVLVSKLNSN